MDRIYNKEELRPSQKLGIQHIEIFSVLPPDLYVKTSGDPIEKVYINHREAIPYVQDVLNLSDSTVFISN